MKTIRLLLAAMLAFALSFSVTGCASLQSDTAKVIPPGNYKSITATITGKFSATSFVGENVTITPEGKMTGGHVHLRHSNVYVPLVEFDIQAADNIATPPAAIPSAQK